MPKDQPAWIAALGEIAERTGHPRCVERFESGRHLLTERAEQEQDDDEVPGPYR